MDYNPYQQQFEEPKYDPRPGRTIGIIGTGLILLLIAILFFILFYNPTEADTILQQQLTIEDKPQPTQNDSFAKAPSKKEVKEKVPDVIEERSIGIVNAKFCDILVNNKCTQKKDNIYRAGDQIKIYFEVVNVSIKGFGNTYALAFDGDFRLFDEYNREILTAASPNFYTYINTGSKMLLTKKPTPMQTFLPSDSTDPKGLYSAQITVYDAQTKEIARQIMEFRLI